MSLVCRGMRFNAASYLSNGRFVSFYGKIIAVAIYQPHIYNKLSMSWIENFPVKPH